MNQVIIDFSKKTGTVKPMHAVNNGPVHKVSGGQLRSNLETFTKAAFPCVRNHDAAFCAAYGGEHIVDIGAVFPDFAQDPENPEAYDFTLTDQYLKSIARTGSEILYRLGSKIEHASKKYGTRVPEDFQKWASVCEHIIRHYNEGWANGLHMDIKYWEIWNEPDQNPDEDPPEEKLCWSGTAAQFYELYKVTAVHLKKKFPGLKIGGPAISHPVPNAWLDGFLQTLGGTVPLDFFSWHRYTTDPHELAEQAVQVRNTLDQYGYPDAESILNEWNYISDWDEKFISSIETIISMKGAAFDFACMSHCQNAPVDMLMYYDARPGCFNGLFDFYTMRPLKGYYAFLIFSALYALKNTVSCTTDADALYITAASGSHDMAAICYYTDDDSAQPKTIQIQLEHFRGDTLCLLDQNHNYEEIGKTGPVFEITLEQNTLIVIK